MMVKRTLARAGGVSSEGRVKREGGGEERGSLYTSRHSEGRGWRQAAESTSRAARTFSRGVLSICGACLGKRP